MYPPRVISDSHLFVFSGTGVLHPAMLISVSASLRLFRYGCFSVWNYACGCSDVDFSGTAVFRLGIMFAVVPVLFFSGMGLMYPAMLISDSLLCVFSGTEY